MTNTRYGVELSYALLTSLFFKHNENIDAKREKRTPCPVSVYRNHEAQNIEQFGLIDYVPVNAPPSSLVSASMIEMRQLTLPEVLHEICNVMVPALLHDFLNTESEEDFCTEGAITVLKQTVSAYYVPWYFDALTKTATLYTSTFFTSFIALTEQLVSSHSNSILK